MKAAVSTAMTGRSTKLAMRSTIRITRRAFFAEHAAGLGAAVLTASAVSEAQPLLRVLLITGGHGFEREPFFAMWKSFDDFEVKPVEHPNAHALFKPEAARNYDVIALYDMWQPITDEAKQDFVNLLKAGKGLVALHHSLVGYQEWDEYAKLIGGKYHLKPRGDKPASTFKHDVKFTVRLADANHPVTRGLKDFEILDETYSNVAVNANVKPLLTTDEPTSTKTIAWTHTYGKSKVAYLQLGHGPTAYENPNYRRLVAQAVRWAGAK